MNSFYTGVVEDRVSDPLKLGRLRVRIVGLHSENKTELPTDALPWAVVMQPTNSASQSGIGHSPTGIVEGSWVIVIFRDQYNQEPIVIGTIPGISGSKGGPERLTGGAINSSGQVWTDGSGNPVQTSGDTSVAEPVAPPDTRDKIALPFSKPGSLKISEAGQSFIKSVEGISSLIKGKNQLGKDSLPASTSIFSYRDSVGVWTVGWGSTKLADGSSVTQDTVISKATADSLFKIKSEGEYSGYVSRLVKVPLTQSMFDAACSLVYNAGPKALSKTTFGAALNSGQYRQAAALIGDVYNNGGTLSGRRLKEYNLFLKDGIPNDDGSLEKVPTTAEKVPLDKTNNSAVIKDKRFIESPTLVEQTVTPGFTDPSNKYPLYFDEPDTHRLARAERIDGTIVFKKEAGVVKGVATADGKTWNQPKTPYNAIYPYNQTYVSESGHVQEFDDTPGNERIHLYHRSGTFTEIDVNGTEVHRIVGDSFEILERNGNVLIKGVCNITVVGDCNIRTENNMTLEALGDMDIKVGGNLGISAGGGIGAKSGTGIDVLSGGDLKLGGANASIEAGKIDLNSGIPAAPVVKLASGTASGEPELSTLSIPSRHTTADMVYERPEDGDPTAYNAEQVKTGVVDPTEPVVVAPEVEAKPAESKPVVKPELVQPVTETEFTWNYRLTENFTLRNTITGTSPEIPVGTNSGLSPKQIVENLRALCANCLEPINASYSNMKITNTFRSQRKNTAIGGAKSSDHLTGSAADIQFGGYSRKQTYEAAQAIYALLGNFHQIILEYKGASTWIHISYRSTGNAKQALTIDASSGTNKTINRGGFTLLG
jgi:GH24 family phage-related lysozyme (muramidase)